MTLLNALGLTPTKAMLQTAAAADDETRVAAKALRPQLAARHKQPDGQYRPLSAAETDRIKDACGMYSSS